MHDTDLCGSRGRNLRSRVNRLSAGFHVVRLSRVLDVLRPELRVFGLPIWISGRVGTARLDQLAATRRVVRIRWRLHGWVRSVELLRRCDDKLLRSRRRHDVGVLRRANVVGFERLLHSLLYAVLLFGVQWRKLSWWKLCLELRSV